VIALSIALLFALVAFFAYRVGKSYARLNKAKFALLEQVKEARAKLAQRGRK